MAGDGPRGCFDVPRKSWPDLLYEQLMAAEKELTAANAQVASLTVALNEKVQHELDEHPACLRPPLTDAEKARKQVLYERDQRLNEPPASYTFVDPRSQEKQNSEQESAD